METFFTGICFSLEILIQNYNTKHNFPIFWLIILVKICLFLQNLLLKPWKHFHKNVCYKSFNWNMFLLKILIQNHNKKHNFPLFWLKILLEIFLLLQNHCLKDSWVTVEKFSLKFSLENLHWNMHLFRNTVRNSWF